MKIFKVTIKAKKDHPKSPDAIVFYTDEFKFAKDAIQLGKEKLSALGEDESLWFNPKAEQSTQDFFDAWKERQSESTSEETHGESQEIYAAVMSNEDLRDVADSFGGIDALAKKIVSNFESACENLAKNERVDIKAMTEKMSNFMYSAKLAKSETMINEVQKFVIVTTEESETVEESTLDFWCAGVVLFGADFNHEDEMESSEAELLASGQSSIEDEVKHFNIVKTRVAGMLGDVDFADIDDKIGFIDDCLNGNKQEVTEEEDETGLTDNQCDAIDAIMSIIGDQSSDRARTRELAADIIGDKVIAKNSVTKIKNWFELNKAGIIGTAAANKIFLSSAIDTALSQKDEAKKEEVKKCEGGFYWFQFVPSFGFGVSINHEDGSWVATFDFNGIHQVGITEECKSEKEAIAAISGVAIGHFNDLMKKTNISSVVDMLKKTISGIGSRNEELISEAKCDKDTYYKNLSNVVNFPKHEEHEERCDIESMGDDSTSQYHEIILELISNAGGDEVDGSMITERGDNLEQVLNELSEIGDFESTYGFEFDESKIIEMLYDSEFDDGSDILRIFANRRVLRGFIRDLIKHNEECEPEEEQENTLSIQVEKPEVAKPEVESGDVSLSDLGLSESVETTEESPEFKNELSPIELFNEKLPELVANGVHIVDDMKNEIYHAVDGISSSKIKDARKSLMYFNNKHNLKCIPEPERGEHFDVGDLCHAMTLETEKVALGYAKEPDMKKPTKPQREKYDAWLELGKPSKEENPKAYPTDLMFEVCGGWDDFYSEHGDVITVSSDGWDLAEKMKLAIYADKDASTILKHPARKSERSWFKIDESTGLLVKVRPDIELGSIIGDLKTISMRGMPDEEKIIQKLRYEILDRGYDLSAAMYLDVTDKREFVWIFVNKAEGYHWVAVIKASEETLNNGYTKYRDSLDKIKQAYDSNHWPKPEPLQRKRNPESGKLELPEI